MRNKGCAIELVVADMDRDIYAQLRSDLCEAFCDLATIKLSVYTQKDLYGYELAQNASCIIINPQTTGNYADLINKAKVIGNIPIIYWDAENTPESRLALLEAGANYILPETATYIECFLAIRNLLLLKYSCGSYFAYKELLFDPLGRNVYFKGVPIELTSKEYDILLCLYSNKGRFLTASQIYEKVWKQEPLDAEKSVKDILYRIRKKLGPGFDETYLESKYACGYRFSAGNH